MDINTDDIREKLVRLCVGSKLFQTVVAILVDRDIF